MVIMMILSFIFTLMFMFVKHPLSMGFILLIQSISIAAISGLMNINFWFSYILFLVMVGGMLVLFIYMTSIASNEKFTFSSSIIITCMIPSIMVALYLTLYNWNLYNELNNKFFNTKYWLNSIFKIMNFPHNMIMIMLMIYLLITLIAVVKISVKASGPLRVSN